MEAFTLFRLDGLAVGGLLALAVRGPVGIRALVMWAYATAVVCGIALIGIWQSPHPRLHGIPLLVLALFFGALLYLPWSLTRPVGGACSGAQECSNSSVNIVTPCTCFSFP